MARDAGCGAGPLKYAATGKNARVTARETCFVDGFWIPELTLFDMRFVRLSQQADAETSAPEELSSFRVGTRHHGFRSSCWPACWLLTGPVKEDTQDEPEINPKVEGPKIQVTQAHRVHPRVHTSKSLLDADLCQVAVDPDEPRTAEVPVVQAKPLECVRRKRMHTQSLRVAAGLRPHVPARWIQRQLPLSCREADHVRAAEWA